MPISSSSPRFSSRSRAGFTLIELLISAAIITIISSIVLVRFNAFDSTVLLKSLAYEVGTTIREAQIYSISVINVVGGTNFRTPYGLHFVDGASSYTLFRYNDVGPTIGETPRFSGGDPITNVRTMSLAGNIQLTKICAIGPDICTLGEIDISFRRPEFGAIFHTPTSYLTSAQLANTSAVRLYFASTREPSRVWIVEVKLLGQISAYACTSNCN
jgi:prepilin-type N-terminal cleavage/methylation domain-containing protein